MELADIESRAIAYAREAGQMAVSHYRGHLEVSYKSKGMKNPVTDVDKGIESFLHSAIARDFPAHAILGEEGTVAGSKGADFLWVLDPLDGTTNFVNGLPFFAVSIGVLYRRKPVVGAIFVARTHLGNEGIFHAAQGKGAFLDGSPIEISGETEPIPSRIVSVPGSYAARFVVDKELRKRHGEPRTLGSVAMELALTAAGAFQFAVFGGPKIWDVAAGTLIVREAGGTIMVRNRETQVWEELVEFQPPKAKQSSHAGALAKWALPVIAGHPRVAAFVAQHLSLRPKSGARGHSGSSQDAGRTGS